MLKVSYRTTLCRDPISPKIRQHEILCAVCAHLNSDLSATASKFHKSNSVLN